MRAEFGPFTFDLCALELSRSGIRLRLEQKPARLLACLIERKGEIVTRDELRNRLWPEDVNLDFDHALNKAVNKLRAVLGDSAANARYLETLSKRGYRFIHEVELVAVIGYSSKTAEEPIPVTTDPFGKAEPPTAPVQVAAQGFWRTRSRIWLSSAAAFAVILAVVPAARVLGHLTRFRAPVPKRVRIPAGLRLITEGDSTLALSPDGSRAAFPAAGADRRPRLWMYDFRSARAQEIPGTDDGTMPFWSPDGTRLGFFAVLELKTVDLSSFSVKTLAPTHSARGGTWSARGVILFAPDTRGPIFRIPADGGTAVPVTVVDSKSGATTHRWPAFLSDGNHFVYLQANHDAPNSPGKLMLASIDEDGPKTLLESDSNASAGSGDLAFVLRGKLLSVHLNSRTFEPDTGVETLADSVHCDGGSWYCSFDSNTAGLLYRPKSQVEERETIAWFDVAGKKIGDLGKPGVYRSVDLSPDGKTVAVTCGDPDQKACLFHQDGAITRIRSSGIVSGSVWAPDSSAIAYLDHRSISDFPLIITPVSRAGFSHPVIDSRADYFPLAWHPKDNLILFERERPGGAYELGILDLKTGETIPYLSDLSSQTGMARFSPDGRWVAFTQQVHGVKQVYMASFPKPSALFPLTTEGGCSAKWRGDGKAIYYLGPGDMLYSVSLALSSAGFRIGKPVPLFHPPIFYAPWNCISFDVSADGHRFVVNSVPDTPSQELVYQVN